MQNSKMLVTFKKQAFQILVKLRLSNPSWGDQEDLFDLMHWKHSKVEDCANTMSISGHTALASHTGELPISMTTTRRHHCSDFMPSIHFGLLLGLSWGRLSPTSCGSMMWWTGGFGFGSLGWRTLSRSVAIASSSTADTRFLRVIQYSWSNWWGNRDSSKKQD